MGMYNNIVIEDGIDLPEYPADPTEPLWQTKTLAACALDVYKISEDGRLLRRDQSFRDKTDEEIQETAEEHGYDSWEEMESDDDFFGPSPNWRQTVDEEWWVDHNQHGSFEFHHVYMDGGEPDPEVGPEDGPPYNYETKDYYSYEATFRKGDLDEIVLLDITDCT